MTGLYKSLGIIFSYIWLVILIYFDIVELSSIFYLPIVEFIVLLVLFAGFDLVEGSQTNYRLGNVVLGASIFIMAQFFGANLALAEVDDNISSGTGVGSIFEWHMMLASLVILTMYVIRMYQLKKKQDLTTIMHSTLFYQAFGIMATNILGLTVLAILASYPIIAVAILLIARSIVEVYFMRNTIRL